MPNAMLGTPTLRASGLKAGYVSRMLRLTTLAPEIVAAILDDDLPDQIKLFDFSAMDPIIWDEQRLLVAGMLAVQEPDN